MVTITLSSGLRSQCVLLMVKPPDADAVASTPIAVTPGKPQAFVGVAQGSLPSEVMIYAEGFSDGACQTPSEPPERSRDAPARFQPGEIRELTIVLPAANPSRESACGN